MDFYYKFNINDPVYLPYDTGRCCLTVFRPLRIKEYYRLYGINFYDVGLEDLVEERFLFTPAEARQAILDDTLGSIECINERLGEI
jgi:hypothetical protein